MSYTKQHTIKKSVSISGVGLHTGVASRVTLHPADPDTGIVFISEGVEIKAVASNVCDTRRGTTLGRGNVKIHTVEHLLSALAGVMIDNVRIDIAGIEAPVMDGSALPFVHLIDDAGIDDQDEVPVVIAPDMPIWVFDGEKCVIAYPNDSYKAGVIVSFKHKMIGEQAISFGINPDVYRKEIAPARTFCTSDEIEYILSQGLGKGGTEDNVVVAYDDHYSTPLRFNNEMVRHKMLDLIGDLSLTGGRIQADVFGLKTSHTLNTDLARRICDARIL
ncbi:MAG: UDP-3-O-acyl-N-acetylglucosamine deacetylase [Armatimonadota bacterium]